jgi:transposase-like protein
MDGSKRELKSYSDAFKQMVMGEILAGLSVSQVSSKYDIGGAMTVYKWCRKYNIEPNKRVTIDVPLDHNTSEEMRSKKSKTHEISESEKIKLLEYELALYKKLVEIAKRDYNLDLLKKPNTKPSKK